jgi:hypothetical protein
MDRRLAWALLPFLSGCIVNQVTSFAIGADRCSEWYETGAVQKPLPEIARTVHEAILRQGFEMPSFDERSGHLETAWNTSMSPRFRESTRTMLEVDIVALDKGGYNVRIRSYMEINDSSAHPGEADKASWVGAGASEKHKQHISEAALRLHSVLKLRYFGLNP